MLPQQSIQILRARHLMASSSIAHEIHANFLATIRIRRANSFANIHQLHVVFQKTIISKNSPDSLEQEGRSLGSRPAKGSPSGFAAAVRPKAKTAMRVVKEGFMVLMWTEDGCGEFVERGFGFGLGGSRLGK